MPPTITELQQKRAKAIADARSISEAAGRDGGRGLNAEERGRFDAFMKEAKGFKAQIDELEGDAQRMRELETVEGELQETRGRQTGGENPDRGGAGREADSRGRGATEWRTGSGQTRRIEHHEQYDADSYRRAYRQMLRTGQSHRDLVADSGVEGGHLIAPMQMAAGLIKAVDDLTWIRQLATVTLVTQAQSLGMVSLDADPEDGEWTSEVTVGTKDTSMRFGARELNPQLLSKEIQISRKLLEMSPDVERLVLDRLAYKFGITEEKNYLIGDGANKPLGLFVAHNDGIPTSRDSSTGNTSTAITADGCIRAKGALKAQYRNRPGTRWLFHRDAVTQLCLLKDSTNNYIWRQGLVGGEPDTLLNIKIAESEYVPNTFTTGLYVGLLGDFSFYHIAERTQLDIQRLDQLEARKNKIVFIGRRNIDAMPVLAEAFVRVKLG